jgi:hypothetical protein
MYVFRSPASSSTRGEVGLSVKEPRFWIVVSTRVYPRGHSVQITVGSVYPCLSLSLSLRLRPTVSRPVCLGIKHPSGAYDQIFIMVWQLRGYWFGAPSITRGRVSRLQLLLALASAVIFWSEFRRTRGHILLSQIRDFPFRRLLRLAGSRWRNSTPPPHEFHPCHPCLAWSSLFNFEADGIVNNSSTIPLLFRAHLLPRERVQRAVAQQWTPLHRFSDTTILTLGIMLKYNIFEFAHRP